jgi:hypothetical protein
VTTMGLSNDPTMFDEDAQSSTGRLSAVDLR